MTITLSDGTQLQARIAFNNSPSDPTYTYTDITDKIRHSAGIRTATGRSAELGRFEAGQCQFVLDNSGRTFDPEHANGPYRSTEMFFSKEADGYMELLSANAPPATVFFSGAGGDQVSTPDASKFAITTRMDLFVQMSPYFWNTATESTIASKWQAGQQSWRFYLTTTKGFGFQWHDGTAVRTATAKTDGTKWAPNGLTRWVRVTFDGNTGSRGTDHLVRFAWSNKRIPFLDDVIADGTVDDYFTVVHDASRNGTSSIQTTTSSVMIGSHTGGTAVALGNFAGLRMYNGIVGSGTETLVSSVDFWNTAQGWETGDAAAATGTAATGEVWTIAGASARILSSLHNIQCSEFSVVIAPTTWVTAKKRRLVTYMSSTGNPQIELDLLATGTIEMNIYDADGTKITQTGLDTVQRIMGVTDGEPVALNVAACWDEHPSGDLIWPGGRTTTAHSWYMMVDGERDTHSPDGTVHRGTEPGVEQDYIEKLELGNTGFVPITRSFNYGFYRPNRRKRALVRMASSTASGANLTTQAAFRASTTVHLYIGGYPGLVAAGTYEQFDGQITAFKHRQGELGHESIDWEMANGIAATTRQVTSRTSSATPYQVTFDLKGSVAYRDTGTALKPFRPVNVRINRSFGSYANFPGTSGNRVVRAAAGGIPGSLYCDGSGGDRAAADNISFPASTNLEIVAAFRAADWTPASAGGVMAQWATGGNNRAWGLQVNTDGTLGLTWSTDGTATGVQTANSTSATGFTDGVWGWVRSRLVLSDHNSVWSVTFETSLDPPMTPRNLVTWTKLGNTVLGAGATSIYAAGTALVTVGTLGTATLDGHVAYASLNTGLGGSRYRTFDFTNPNDWTPGSSTGKTRQGQVATLTQSTLTAGYHLANEPFELRVHLRSPDLTPAAKVTLLDASGASNGYRLSITTGGALELALPGGSTHTSTVNLETVATADTDFWVGVRFSGALFAFRYSNDGVDWRTLDTVTSAVGPIYPTAALRIGEVQAAGSPFTGRIYRAQVWRGDVDAFGRRVVDIDFTGRSATDTAWTTPGGDDITLTTATIVAEAAEWRDLFTGYIVGWPQETDEIDNAPVVPIEAVDGFEIAAATPLPTDMFGHILASTGPAAWWRLNEGAGQNEVQDWGWGKRSGQATRVVPGGPSVTPSNPEDQSARFNNTGFVRCGRDLIIPTPNDVPWTLGIAFRINELPADGEKHVLFWHATKFKTKPSLIVFFNRFPGSVGTVPRMHVLWRTTAGGTNSQRWVFAGSSSFPGIAVGDGSPHYMTFSFMPVPYGQFDGMSQITVDGTKYLPQEPSGSASGAPPGFFKFVSRPSGINIGHTGTETETPNTDIAHVAVWRDNLSIFGTTDQLHDAWKGTYKADQDFATRTSLIMDLLRIPRTLRNISTRGVTSFGALVDLTTFGLDYLRGIAATEGGDIFIDGSGIWQMTDRYHRIDSPRSQIVQHVIGDNHVRRATVPVKAGRLSGDASRDNIYNMAEIRTAGGGRPVLTGDERSIKQYGGRVLPLEDSLGGSVEVSLAQAEYQIERHKEPVLRYPVLDLVPLANPGPNDNWTRVQSWRAATARIGDRIEFHRQPNRTGDSGVTDHLVEGIGHAFTDKMWITKLFISPTDTAPYWRWNEGRWGKTTKWIY